MRTLVARGRMRPLARSELRGGLGRLGEVARDRVLGVRVGLLLVIGQLRAFDRG